MDLSMTQLIGSVLGGGGEMSERMRALDWSTTALGPLEQWPGSLRICVRIVLASGYPMTIYWGPDYTMLYNDACRQVMGTKHPAALGRGFREAFPEMWDSVGPLLDKVMTQRQNVSTLTDQLFLLNRNNYIEECYFATSFSPIPNDTGEVGGVLNTALETTERVIEDRRRQLLRDLAWRAAEARNEDVVWRVSAETLSEHHLSVPFAFLYAHQPAEGRAHLAGATVEATGLAPAVIDCTDQNPWRLDAALPMEGVVVELGPRVLALPKSTWPVPAENATVVPVRLREDSGAAGFLVLGIHPGRAFDERYRHFVRRISEQIATGLASARAYEQERRRAEALAKLDRVKTQFFSNVSHEFRTPLTLMLGPLDEVLPEARERLSPERHEQLVAVRRNALRLLKLVNTLLDFSRIEAGRLQAVYQPTDLATLTSEIASMFDSAMDNAGLRFSVDCQPIGEPVYVDHDMWEKVVFNLLSNAFKFTFEGEVALTLKPVDGAVELHVRDTGVGIADEEHERVFERFHRIESTRARTYEGTGIGLALVQELVKLHGGGVRLHSALGQGSTFTVTIPRGNAHLPVERIRTEQSRAPTKTRAEAYVEEVQRWLPDASSAAVDMAMLAKLPSLASSPEAALGTKREVIVLADDNADMREYVSRLLGDQYDVHAVPDGRQALEAARQLRPALVLADLMMPRLDGFGLLRAIRGDSALCSTPVILISARAGEESRIEGLQADADDYLVKPFTARELLARVATHVKMANLRRETAEREERLRASEERLVETGRLFRELKQTEEALQSSERNLGAIVNTIPTAAWTTRSDGYCDFLNRVWLDYAGLTVEQAQGWGWAEAIHPDDRTKLVEEWQLCLASGTPIDTEARIRRFDSSYRWFLIRGNPLKDEGGNILKWYGTCVDIEDRKRGEEALRTRELSWRQIVDNIPGLVAATSAMGEVEFLNRQTLEYFGKTNEELKNWALIGAVHPDDLPRVIEARKKSIVAGQTYEIEHRCRRADGVYRWFQVRGVPVRDLENKITAWYLLLTDIDDRKKAEEALQSSERNLSLMINAIPTYIHVLSTDGSVLHVNQAVLDYYGISLEDVQKEDYRARFFHPDDVERLREERREALKRAVPFENEQRVLGKDGKYRWFLIRYSPLLDAQGRIDRWYVAATDIEDRKSAEARVEQAYLRLAEAQRLSKTGSYITDLVADEHNFSEETFRIFEFDPATKITLQMVRGMIHPEDQPTFDAVIARAMTGADFDFGFRIVTSRGAVKHLRGVTRVMGQNEGHPVFIGALQDVTESKLAEEALNRARSELAHVTRITTLNALTASIAHEVNQPLSGIVSNASASLRFLAGDAPNLEEAREAVRDIVRDGKRAGEIISRIRALTKRTSAPREKLDLSETISEVLALIGDEAKRNNVIVRTQFDDTLSPVAGDRVQLQQVVLNLVMNAIEAMSSVSERPRELVITTQNIDPDCVQATVADSGIGIAADTLDKIFDSFYTTKSGGMGMGLSISRSILQSHGGRLWAVGRDGPGTVFHFTVPKYHEEGAHAPATGT